MRRTSRGAASSAAPARKTIREAPIITGKSGGIGRRLILILPSLCGHRARSAVSIAGRDPPPSPRPRARPRPCGSDRRTRRPARRGGRGLQLRQGEAGRDQGGPRGEPGQADRRPKPTSKRPGPSSPSGWSRSTRKATGVLDTLVGSDSFSDLINRLDLMERLSEQDSETGRRGRGVPGRGGRAQGRTGAADRGPEKPDR